MGIGRTRDGPGKDEYGEEEPEERGPRRNSGPAANPRHTGGNPQPPLNHNGDQAATQSSGHPSPEDLRCNLRRRLRRTQRGAPLSARTQDCQVRCRIIGREDNGLRSRLIEDVLFGRWSQLPYDDSPGLPPVGVPVPRKPPTLEGGAYAPLPEHFIKTCAVT